ncbi:hypothetical protein P152DRAFT_397621 [Eremomyces bilateralis CBS 781.70]|uniref:G-protein coupled receptors family 2 profile 2 domain-containing protein n=1 Tax=Eremomyces bilateralis CBS 781.70 TaxID=1392243 RepID=A0A6G1G206_9PEZI|nr:uncharacterized protein P152DRAFT_397621 [Eremomyces bilateralis CBS 781.70]KAF1812145.1 hypothetical protein P152DRAFT_397621 [Eremomyces bilateralis CBS 781.70]
MFSNRSIEELRGLCPMPFLDVKQFPPSDGYTPGRFCSSLGDGLTCCLPCPATDWIFPENFHSWSRATEVLSALSVAVSLFLLISYAALPAEKSRRHYLSVCLVIGIGLLELGFVVPLAAQPEQCFNEITPNDMYSSMTCAWSGAFIISGSLTTGMWIFIRTLSMHLQICWDVVPGKKFFYGSQALGWGLVSLFFVLTLVFTGVSFRFGDACHVNSEHSTKDFWGPMLGMAGASALLQIATFGYCIHVYIKNMFSDEKTETSSSGGLASYSGSAHRNQTARGVYRRVTKVLWLQWRAILMVIFILADVIFLSVVFIYLNDITDHAFTTKRDQLMPWLTCLLISGGRKEECFADAQRFLISQPVVTAILMLLGLAGIQVFLLLSRFSLLRAWYDFFRKLFVQKSEFVSLDAKRYSNDARQYELLKVKSPVSTITSPTEVYQSPGMNGRQTPDYFQSSQRQYHTPSMSFSSPRPPSSGGPQSPQRLEWDPRSTHARGGLGLHPPIKDEEDAYDGMSNRL